MDSVAPTRQTAPHPTATSLQDVSLPEGRSYTEDDLKAFVQVGAMSASIAHQMRNPLAGISAMAEIIRSSFDDDDERVEFADVILEEVEKAQKSISDLLAFARRKEPYIAPAQLSSEMDRVVAAIEPLLNAKGITVHREYADDEILAAGDSEMLHQSLVAVVTNAVEAMDEGGTLCLRIGLAQDESREGRWLQVDVADNGSGIAPEHMGKLFDPFFSTKANGIGLGLPVVKRLIEQQNGEVSLVSWHGEGSVFTALLPTMDDDAP